MCVVVSATKDLEVKGRRGGPRSKGWISCRKTVDAVCMIGWIRTCIAVCEGLYEVLEGGAGRG